MHVVGNYGEKIIQAFIWTKNNIRLDKYKVPINIKFLKFKVLNFIYLPEFNFFYFSIYL